MTKIPLPISPTQLATHWKKEAKVKRIILDFVTDQLISYISDKRKGKKMFEALVELFQNACAS